MRIHSTHRELMSLSPSRLVHRISSGVSETTQLSSSWICLTSPAWAWNAVYFCRAFSWYVSTTYDATVPCTRDERE